MEVFRRSAAVLSAPVYVGAVIAVASRCGGATALQLALAAMATILMIAVAAMTEGGFAGNLRYVALPAALVCVLAGAGWVDLVRLPRRRGALRRRARRGGAAGGRDPVRRCRRRRPRGKTADRR